MSTKFDPTAHAQAAVDASVKASAVLSTILGLLADIRATQKGSVERRRQLLDQVDDELKRFALYCVEAGKARAAPPVDVEDSRLIAQALVLREVRRELQAASTRADGGDAEQRVALQEKLHRVEQHVVDLAIEGWEKGR